MEIKDGSIKNSLHMNLAQQLMNKKATAKKDTPDSVGETLAKVKMEEIKANLAGKVGLKLDELNKQKVTPDVLEKAIDIIKQADKNKDGKVTAQELKEHIEQKKKKEAKKDEPIDPKDKNRDGKVSQSEKEEAAKKNKPIEPEDKNRDGKVTQQEKTEAKEAKEKKTLGMVKDIIGELKKDDDFKEVKPEQFKGISKMVNNELIEPKDAERINKFLNN